MQSESGLGFCIFRSMKKMILLGMLMGLLSCKSTQSSSTGFPVRYTVIVTSQAGVPLDSARVVLHTEGDDSYAETTSESGRAIFEVESATNQFSVSRKGYWDLDTIDQVTQPTDTTEDAKVILRILQFRMTPNTGVLSSSVVSSSVAWSSAVSSSRVPVSSSSTGTFSSSSSPQ